MDFSWDPENITEFGWSGFGRKSYQLRPEGRGIVNRLKRVGMRCVNAKERRMWLLPGSRISSGCLDCHWE